MTIAASVQDCLAREGVDYDMIARTSGLGTATTVHKRLTVPVP